MGKNVVDIYLKDYLVSRIISFGKEIPGYGRVYYRTNEDLDTIYRDLDFHKKKVLSVLASGDQVFTARYLGAEQVDSFDKNRDSIIECGEYILNNPSLLEGRVDGCCYKRHGFTG